MNIKPLLLGIGLVALTLSMSGWTPVVIVSTHEDNMRHSNSWPEIAVDGSGNSYVVWYGSDGNDKEIYWVKVDASGTPGTVHKISTHPDNIANDDWYPQIAVDASGNSYITWHCFHEDSCDIYWMKINTSGTLGQVQKISGHPDCTKCGNWYPQIAVDAAGNSYITWYGSNGDDTDIHWVKIDTSGTLSQVQKISNYQSDIDHSNSDPRIAVDTSGNSYVVWSGLNEESYDIYWARIDASGMLGEVQKISTQSGAVSFDDQYPQIAVDAAGNSYVTWESFDGDDSDIYWVKIDESGTLGTIQKVSNYLGSTTFDDSGPYMAIDGLGNSYVTWSSYNRGIAEDFDQRVCWVKIDTSGRPEQVQKVSTHPDSKHIDWNSRIAVDAAGNSYVVWEGEGASKNSHIFFTAHLPNSTSATIPVITLIGIAIVVTLAVIIARKRVE